MEGKESEIGFGRLLNLPTCNGRSGNTDKEMTLVSVTKRHCVTAIRLFLDSRTLQLSAAEYQINAGFSARHENTHVQQIEAALSDTSWSFKTYSKGEKSPNTIGSCICPSVNSEKNTAGSHLLSIYVIRARQNEKIYEGSINAYKDMSTFHFVRTWKLTRRVRDKKRDLQQSNRSSRSYCDVHLPCVQCNAIENSAKIKIGLQ